MLPPFILFDLDDTLFDHRRASRIALQAVHAAHACDLDPDAFADEHARVLEQYHQRFLAGEMSLDQARAARMIEAFATFGRTLSVEESLSVAALYRREHRAHRALLPGARELLEALAGKVRLGLVSNNAVAEQFDKLRRLDIARYFAAIVISEDVGVTKPDPRIFAIALERLGARAADTVMIGDSRAADIDGACQAGLAAVWLNRPNHTKINAKPALAPISGQKRS
jgi:putative hydrolase of the HAD superfamily